MEIILFCFQLNYGGVLVPDWELQSGFKPSRALSSICKEVCWTTLGGGNPQTPSCAKRFEDVLLRDESFDTESLPLRDPDYFVAGEVHRHLEEWEKILVSLGDSGLPCDEIRCWLQNGLDVTSFFKKFKGKFRKQVYNSSEPPNMYFPNALSCRNHASFVASELEKMIANGAISVLGRIGECELPKVIMPLTVEPTKPRLCHDNRFVNQWLKDCPFKLETLKDVHRIVAKDSLMVSCDEKSGYNHVRLSEGSKTYFGIQFAGYVMVYNTLPFGLKLAPYVYNTVGMVPTMYLRSFGVAVTQYIDDRFGTESRSKVTSEIVIDIDKTRYAIMELLTRLGYFLALQKSVLYGRTSLKYLGFIIDSVKQAYLLPQDKLKRFIDLRENILSGQEVDVKTLQKFAGKCISMALAVPGASLYTREVNRAISFCIRNDCVVKLYRDLREELEHWRFLDDWDGFMPWRLECHKQVSLATDSSLYKYGVVVISGNKKGMQFSDFWEDNDDRPIHLKEAHALLLALRSILPDIIGHRVDVLTDSKALLFAWQNQGGRDKALTDFVKQIFQLVYENKIHLSLSYIPSKANPADAPSRGISMDDVMLSRGSWRKVEDAYGPHSVDLMAIDSNAMRDEKGVALRHFTPGPSPNTSGVNLFAQDVSLELNPYVFPPASLILSVLNFLIEQMVKVCTMVVLVPRSAPLWLPVIDLYVKSKLVLGEYGQCGVILVPSKGGYIPDKRGLEGQLVAYRIVLGGK